MKRGGVRVLTVSAMTFLNKENMSEGNVSRFLRVDKASQCFSVFFSLLSYGLEIFHNGRDFVPKWGNQINNPLNTA